MLSYVPYFTHVLPYNRWNTEPTSIHQVRAC